LKLVLNKKLNKISMESPLHIPELTQALKNKACDLGFSFCGVAEARFLEEEAPRVELWLKQGYQSGMAYMENYFDMRLDPRILLPGARSVISLAFNYFPGDTQAKEAPYKISKYAYGLDYHEVIRGKLNQLVEFLRSAAGDIHIRSFVDSAPVLERAWAVQSGIGWIGRNSMLISRRNGSFFFLAELITDLSLEFDAPSGGNYCGDCSRCIDACPTDAIKDFTVDASRCISYLTIELKDELSPAPKGSYPEWIFGCDVCQDVCPWNRFSTAHAEPALAPLPGLLELSAAGWEQMDEESFRQLFRHSAIKRAKLRGLKRNIDFLKD
jgi:epoxyqueuosine reductase